MLGNINRPHIGFVDMLMNSLLLRGPKRLKEVAEQFELLSQTEHQGIPNDTISNSRGVSNDQTETATKPTNHLKTSKIERRRPMKYKITVNNGAIGAIGDPGVILPNNLMEMDEIKRVALVPPRRRIRILRFPRGVVTRISIVEPKIPGGPATPVVYVRVTNGAMVKAYLASKIPDLKENSSVVIRKAHVQGMPGVHYKVVRLMGK